MPLLTQRQALAFHLPTAWGALNHGDLVYAGDMSLQVVDYSDPSNPTQAAYYIAPGTIRDGDRVLSATRTAGEDTTGVVHRSSR